MREILLPVASGWSPLRREGFDSTSSAGLTFGEGFYEEEREGQDPFRWMSLRGRLTFAPSPDERFLELGVFSEFGDLSQELEFRSGSRGETLALPDGWCAVSLPIASGADGVLLSVNKLFPRGYHPSDERALSIRVRRPSLHSDPARHASIRAQWSNAVLNAREMLEGKVVLDSTPSTLGIDLHGACNVKPPCVYCEWDTSKDQEGDDVDAPFTVETLRDYGPFFDHASYLVNCSIGEPFLMRELDEILDVFGSRGKTLEMSTNGQILTDRNIEKLLGRDVHLYVSLDAATPETYARLRNRTFERILDNLRRLVKAKGGRGHLPKVFLVFMPMRANVHELEAFVELSAELGVDHLVLRPLNDTPGNGMVWDRNEYRFDYEKELLPFHELVRISGRARELCRRWGVELHDQLDFGGSLEGAFQEDFDAGRQEIAPEGPSNRPVSEISPEAPAEIPPEEKPSLGFEKWPVCTEPWKRLYILRRGIRPCCYGGAPLARMDGFAQVWNAPILQEIRAKLLRGTFHSYCLKSPACPIVRKSEHGRSMPVLQRGMVGLWRSWQALNAVTGGAPRWVWRRFRTRVGSGSPAR
jgi:sulfatase maturation enzyme AslB (radical SAM superfamily)